MVIILISIIRIKKILFKTMYNCIIIQMKIIIIQQMLIQENRLAIIIIKIITK